jgi:uncharacterized protein involved in exopolysaccharide biosynthesis
MAMTGDSEGLRAPAGAERQDGDLDAWSVASIIWRRRRLVLVTTLIVVGLAAVFLIVTRPQYTSQAAIIIENRESAFTRPAREGEDQFLSDQAAVLSQVEVLSSRDLSLAVVDKLELGEVDEFTRDRVQRSLLSRLLSLMGLATPRTGEATQSQVVDAFQEQLEVFQRGTSRVIAVSFTSTDAERAASIANMLAEEYIAEQRVSKFDSNQDAIAWLGREIDQLRGKVSEAEAKVAKYRSDAGIFETARESSLDEQQLGQLNGELVRAASARSEAEAKARLINDLLEGPGSIEEAADVLGSPLIQRLREQQAAVSREHAELSATLLPAHPRMRELTAELSDLDARIASEARKIARGLENEAAIAGSRVDAIKETLAQFKVDAGETSQAEVELRALEREAAAQREILESFLRRYREATARQDVDVQVPNARIISRASVATTPSYPPRGPILALASVSGLLIGLMAAIVAEMTGARGAGRSRPEPDPRKADSHEPGLEAHDMRSAAPPAPSGARGEAMVAPQPIGKRIARLVIDRGMRRIALLPLVADQSCTSVALRLAAEAAGHGLNPVVVGLAHRGEAPQEGGPQEDTRGLFDVLAGTAALGQVISRDAASGVQMLAAGTRPDNGEELLRSGRVALVIDALLRRFDAAIITADAIDSAEAAACLSGCCDLVLVAAPSDELSGRRIGQAVAKLREHGFEQAAIVSVGPDALTLYDAVSVRGGISNAA